MKLPDLRHLDGYLPSEMEKAYLQHYLRSDTMTAIVSLGLFCLLLMAFSFNDYVLFGLTTPFYLLIGFRGLYLAYFIFLMTLLWNNQNPEKYERNLFTGMLIGFILITIINLTRPLDYSGNFGVDAVIILLIYTGVPIRLDLRTVGGLIYTVGSVLNFLILRHPSSTAAFYAAVIVLIAANLIGIFASTRLYSLRRREFRARLEQQKASELTLKEAEQWQTTFDAITDLVSIQDKNYKLVRVNKAYADIFGLNPEDLTGKSCHEVVHGTSCPVPTCPQRQSMNTRAPHTEELFEPRLGIHMEVSCSPIRNEQGEIEGTVHIVKDITQRVEFQKKLEQMAMYDALTGLPNRSLLYDRFQVAQGQADRYKRGMTVMMLDLDRFKAVNDTLGHAAGDVLLKATAKRLGSLLRKSDTFARLGGDEFAVLAPEMDRTEDSAAIAAKIVSAINEPFEIDGHKVNIGTSIGIAVYPHDGRDIDELLKSADRAMYYVKGHGRNSYRFARDADSVE